MRRPKLVLGNRHTVGRHIAEVLGSRTGQQSFSLWKFVETPAKGNEAFAVRPGVVEPDIA